MKAPIIEIFSSFQGEGLLIGQRQIFVRFAGCNLNCNYCDTQDSKSEKSGKLMTPKEVVEEINNVLTPDCKTISFTGGEPSLYPEFINEVSKYIYSLIKRKDLIEKTGQKILFEDFINLLIIFNMKLRKMYLHNLYALFSKEDTKNIGIININ